MFELKWVETDTQGQLTNMNENRQSLLIGMMIIAKILITRILLLSDKSGIVKFITEEMTLEK